MRLELGEIIIELFKIVKRLERPSLVLSLSSAPVYARSSAETRRGFVLLSLLFGQRKQRLKGAFAGIGNMVLVQHFCDCVK